MCSGGFLLGRGKVREEGVAGRVGWEGDGGDEGMDGVVNQEREKESLWCSFDGSILGEELMEN
jgi:hypothetical protein